MTAAALLSKLDKVKRTGPNRWIACCPGHEDRRPSLAIRELPDGTTLINCFVGCEPRDILSAVELTFTDIFPTRGPNRERRPFNAHDVLQCLVGEITIAAIASSDLAKGLQVSEVDRERLLLAAQRIESGRRLANGDR